MLGKWKSNRTFNFKPVNDEELLQECWQKEREKVVARMKENFESSDARLRRMIQIWGIVESCTIGISTNCF